jgi:hypothetical protein
MVAGRILMAILGAFFWSYTLWPHLPVLRSLPYFWRGNLPASPEWRAMSAVLDTLLIAAAGLIGPPFFG